MRDHLLLVAPAANRVYAAESPRLAAAELTILLGLLGAEQATVETTSVAGVDYLRIAAADLDERQRAAVGRASVGLALFRRSQGLLEPVPLRAGDLLDDDLVTIPKYSGKTNELFTRLLLNVTVASARRELAADAVVLDPMCGRGTTLSTALRAGYDAAGVEADAAAVESYATFLRTYLRRKQLKHTVDIAPVRREGRSLGRRLDVQVTPRGGGRTLRVTVFTGDTRQSAALFGKRRFDVVVTDAPYGVVHGSRTGGGRDRSARRLLAEALGVWAGQLKTGGALGLSWNTYTATRAELSAFARDAGLRVLDAPPYLQLAHRVDAGIHRDVLVAVKDAAG